LALKTLVDHLATEAAVYVKARSDLVTALDGLRPEAATAREDVDTRTVELVKTRGEADALRAQLATGPPVAVTDQLALKLEKKVQEIHVRELALVEVQAKVVDLDAQAAALGRQAERAGAAERDALAQQEAAAERVSEQAAWEAAITQAGVRDKAAAAPADAAKTAARTHLRNDLPAELFARAEDRWERADHRLADAAVVADEASLTLATQTGDLARTRRAYERTREALSDFATSGAQDLDAALDLLEAVADAPALSAETKARLQGTLKLANGDVDPDAKDLFDDGEAAAVKEQAREAKLDDVDKAVVELEKARVAALAADPDADVEKATNVKQAVTDLKNARTAAPAIDAQARTDLDAWEAAVPEGTWTLFHAYKSAEATLDRLAAATDRAQELKDAEDAYVVELAKAGKAQRAHWALEARTEIYAARAAALRRAADVRLVTALRGDAWEIA
jgi:hypothetical protein